MSYSIAEWIISLYPLLAVLKPLTAYSLMPHLLSTWAKSESSANTALSHIKHSLAQYLHWYFTEFGTQFLTQNKCLCYREPEIRIGRLISLSITSINLWLLQYSLWSHLDLSGYNEELILTERQSLSQWVQKTLHLTCLQINLHNRKGFSNNNNKNVSGSDLPSLSWETWAQSLLTMPSTENQVRKIGNESLFSLLFHTPIQY